VELLLLKGHLAEDWSVAVVGVGDIADGGLEAENDRGSAVTATP
jgi:hypothetical protein